MANYVQVLGTGAGNSPPALFFFFGKHRYLINCGEGTQRFCVEHKIKLARINHIFFTSLAWERTGGIPGSLLTIADLSVATDCINLFGPEHLRYFTSSLRYFVHRPHLGLRVREFAPPPTRDVVEQYLDAESGLRVRALVINATPHDESVGVDECDLGTLGSLDAGDSEVEMDGGDVERPPSPVPRARGKRKMISTRGGGGDGGDGVESSSIATNTSTLCEPTIASDARHKRTKKHHANDEFTMILASSIHSHRQHRVGVDRPKPEDIVEISSDATGPDDPSVRKNEPQVTSAGGESKRTFQSDTKRMRPKLVRTSPLPRIEKAPPAHHVPSSVCYAFHSPPLPGKFDPSKARALGIPSGPLYGRLSKGESVISPSTGVEVHPTDVISPSRPGPVFCVVDCPSVAHVPGLISHTGWNIYFKDVGREGEMGAHETQRETIHVSAVFHFTPAEVLRVPAYAEWMNRFGSGTTHVLVNGEDCQDIVVFLSSAKNHNKLNRLCPKVFPTLHVEDIPPLILPGLDPFTSLIIVRARPLLKYYLNAIKGVKQGINEDAVIKEDTLDAVASIWPMEGSLDLQRCMKRLKSIELGTVMARVDDESGRRAHSKDDAMPCATRFKDVSLLFLGTGSAMPAKYRNVTGIYLSFPLIKGDSTGDMASTEPLLAGVILDAGEGTLGQLYRRYGWEATQKLLCALRVISISHMHADHHLGVIRLLLHRQRAVRSLAMRPPPLIIVGPLTMHHWLKEYTALESLHYRFVDCAQLRNTRDMSTTASDMVHEKEDRMDEQMMARKDVLEYFERSLGLVEFTAVPVVHCINAYGFVLRHKEGWSITYSGDTRPHEALARAGLNSTVLVHEATFEDGMVKEAMDKKHSTTGEAIKIGHLMQAEWTILTHFSQRYPKVPVVDSTYGNRTGIAFDFMEVHLPNLPILPELLAPLSLLFPADGSEEEKEES